MATQQRHEPFFQVPAGVFAPMQRLTGALVTGPTYEPPDQEREEDGQDLVNRLQQWICELLIKNQQLRMSLQSATALKQEDQDSRNLKKSGGLFFSLTSRPIATSKESLL